MNIPLALGDNDDDGDDYVDDDDDDYEDGFETFLLCCDTCPPSPLASVTREITQMAILPGSFLKR